MFYSQTDIVVLLILQSFKAVVSWRVKYSLERRFVSVVPCVYSKLAYR